MLRVPVSQADLLTSYLHDASFHADDIVVKDNGLFSATICRIYYEEPIAARALLFIPATRYRGIKTRFELVCAGRPEIRFRSKVASKPLFRHGIIDIEYEAPTLLLNTDGLVASLLVATDATVALFDVSEPKGLSTFDLFVRAEGVHPTVAALERYRVEYQRHEADGGQEGWWQ